MNNVGENILNMNVKICSEQLYEISEPRHCSQLYKENNRTVCLNIKLFILYAT